MAIATAAKQVIHDNVPVAVGGGLESISLVQNEHMNTYRARDEWLMKHKQDIYMAMIDTAAVVAKRYGISPEAQDEYALESQTDRKSVVEGKREKKSLDCGGVRIRRNKKQRNK